MSKNVVAKKGGDGAALGGGGGDVEAPAAKVEDDKRFKGLLQLFFSLHSFFVEVDGFKSFLLRYIFLTTHSMEEAEALCDELAIMDAGELVVQGSPEQLKGALGGDVVRLVVARVGPEPPRFEAVEGVVRVTREQRAEGSIVFRVTVRDGPRRLAALVEVARELEIEEVTLHRPSLEHVFLRHTGHEFEESDA